MTLELARQELDAARRVIVALDVDNTGLAGEVIQSLGDTAGGFKVGLELLMSGGLDLLSSRHGFGGRFLLDGKFHDIPNTVRGAARAVSRLPISMFTVHANGGLDMMRAAVEGAREGAGTVGRQPPKVLGVTVLTSIDKLIMNRQLGVPGQVADQVTRLVSQAMEAGLDGIVCSPLEIAAVRKQLGSGPLVLAPGVRPSWAPSQDQRRVLTPSDAIRAGASYLVIGRPILHPPKEVGTPVEALNRIAQEISGAE